MADEKGKEELNVDGGKKKKLLIIIIAVVVLAIGGGAAFMFMGGSDVSEADVAAELDASEPDAEGESASGGGSVETGSALYVPMPRPFRFNVPGAARDRFVEIRVQLLVRGSDNEEEAKKHIPLIESTFLAVFSQANADDLATSAGKTSLKQFSLKEIQKTMQDVTGKKIVEKVLFTGFVMQ